MSYLDQKTIALAAAVFIAAAAGTAWALTRPDEPRYEPSVQGISRQLVFGDEFNGATLSKDSWNTCYDNLSLEFKGCTNYGNDESQWYEASRVAVKDGSLVLSAQKRPVAGVNKDGQHVTYDYSSGMISTGRFLRETPEKWSRQYGFFEARINAPAGTAVWPAFWLSPINYTWPPEIDVVELLGHKPNEILATYFWKNAQGDAQQDSTTYKHETPLADTWHVYAVDWREDHISWYVDGVRVKHVTSANVPRMPMQINLNLAVGGRLPGNPDATTPTASTMLVDYVRVYE